MINIAITDDHPAVATGVQSMFEGHKEIKVAAIYASGKAVREAIPASDIQVLLLDINLPDADGTVLCKELLSLKPELKIIAFTSYLKTAFLKKMMQNGASGFLLKNSGYDEITDAIYNVMDGQEYIQEEMKALLMQESLKRKPDRSFIPKLTRREKEILSLILEEHTTQEIAEKLFISAKTVETHRLNMLQKLGVKNTAGLVKVAIEKGLV